MEQLIKKSEISFIYKNNHNILDSFLVDANFISLLKIFILIYFLINIFKFLYLNLYIIFKSFGKNS